MLHVQCVGKILAHKFLTQHWVHLRVLAEELSINNNNKNRQQWTGQVIGQQQIYSACTET